MRASHDNKQNNYKISINVPNIGDWCRLKKLGAGRFGEVWLWQHSTSSTNIAIKSCHNVSEPMASEKRRLWKDEADLLTTRIRHPNIVQVLDIQSENFLVELNKYSNGIPSLVMEYCSGGNLRQQLLERRNAYGMSEPMVIAILSDMKEAIHYLHSMEIIHRNICPENIVIKISSNNQRTYKLCNIGVTTPPAVLCAEFNSTTAFDYIAPELIISDKNNLSADYWSLGIIAYEIATGYKPFAAHLPSGQWVLRIRDKKSEHITIYEGDDDQFVYSDRILSENRLSKKFAELLERWLKTALEWNPKQRGYIFEQPKTSDNHQSAPVQKLKFFEYIEAMANAKILTIFILKTQRNLSMAIDENTTFDDLLEFIEFEAQVPKSKCYLIRGGESNHCVEQNTKPIELYDSNAMTEFKPMLYVNQIDDVGATSTSNLSSLENEISPPNLPLSLRKVMSNHDQRLKVNALRKFASDTLYFVENENWTFKTNLHGFYKFARTIQSTIEDKRQNITQLQCQFYGLKGGFDLYKQTHERAESMCQLKNEAIDKYCEQRTRLANHIQLLINACEKIVNRYESINRRCRNISENSPCFKHGDAVDCYHVANVSKAYDKLRKQIDNKKFTDKPHYELYQCAIACIKTRDMCYQDRNYLETTRSLNFIYAEFIELMKAFDKATISAEKLLNDLSEAHQQTIEHIRNVDTINQEEKLLHFVSTSTSDLLEATNEFNPDASTSSQSSQTSGRSDFRLSNIPQNKIKDQFGNSISCFGEGDNIKSLIEDHEHLRISIAGLMKEIDEEFGEEGNIHNELPSHLESI